MRELLDDKLFDIIWIGKPAIDVIFQGVPSFTKVRDSVIAPQCLHLKPVLIGEQGF